jgi:hypothetical protein
MRKYLYLLMLVWPWTLNVSYGQTQTDRAQFDRIDELAKAAEAKGVATSDYIPDAVKGIYEQDNTVVWDSSSLKLFHRGGDEVAVALAHIVGPSKMSDSKIERICDLIDVSFQSLNLIEKPKNRNPGVSLLLLESDRLHTSNPALREKIASLRTRLINLYNGQ